MFYKNVQSLFFYKDDFGIRWPTKVYMPLKEIEPNNSPTNDHTIMMSTSLSYVSAFVGKLVHDYLFTAG